VFAGGSTAYTRVTNANRLDVVAAMNWFGPRPQPPKNENYELAVVALSTHSAE
jgi:hypothetical protein